MRLTLISFFLFITACGVYCQDFKFLKPKLSDSTKVVKTEINKETQFERIYYIDYSRNSKAKEELATIWNDNESIGSTYSGVLKNLKTKPLKFKSILPEHWVKLFKYKGIWILFNDLPKQVITDSCLITFDMDDPTSSILTDYKSTNNTYLFTLQSYNWENPSINLKSSLKIKVIDSKKMITIWRTDFQGEISYDLMVPVNQVSNFPLMVMLETDLMDDETNIFDKIDFENLWNK